MKCYILNQLFITRSVNCIDKVTLLVCVCTLYNKPDTKHAMQRHRERDTNLNINESAANSSLICIYIQYYTRKRRSVQDGRRARVLENDVREKRGDEKCGGVPEFGSVA